MHVHVHHGTREAPAHVTPLEGETLAPGTAGFAQLRLERPIVPAAGDRLVIRQVAPPDTIGGGTVVDPHPRKHGPGAGQTRRLAALASGDPLEQLALALEEAGSGIPVTDAERPLLEQLRKQGRATLVGRRSVRCFSPDRLVEARERIVAALRRAGGRPASRGALGRQAGLDDDATVALLEALVGEGEARALGPGFVACGAATGEDPLEAALLEALQADGREPRSPEALAAALGAEAATVRRTLDRLALEDGVVRVKPALYYHRAGIEDVRRRVVELCRREGSVTIARLRDELSTSRKYAQALLEHFDAERFTRRVGDQHILR
jgi:selenocysteine-specific elongation factor